MPGITLRIDQHFMLWSPIVKKSKGKPEYNQMQHLTEIQENIKRKYNIDIECIVNERFQECLEELRGYAKKETKALHCPHAFDANRRIPRKHVSKLTNSSINSPNTRLAKPAIDIQTVKILQLGIVNSGHRFVMVNTVTI